MTHAAPSNNPQELSYEEVATKCPKVRLSSDVHALNEADIGRLELICNAILFEHLQCLPRNREKEAKYVHIVAISTDKLPYYADPSADIMNN